MMDQHSLAGGAARHTDRRGRDLTPTLIARLRAGDAEAGDWLERLYRQPMSRFCRGYLGSEEEAEDAVQEVFCKVLAATEVPDSFRAWIYRIARNHCLNALRDRARHKGEAFLTSGGPFADSATGNLSRLVKAELRSRLGHLVAALPASQREVLWLRYNESLSRAEIAEVLELPESVVKSRLFEGLKKLREHTSLLKDP